MQYVCDVHVDVDVDVDGRVYICMLMWYGNVDMYVTVDMDVDVYADVF